MSERRNKKSSTEGRQPRRSLPEHWGGSPDPEELDETPVEMPLGACQPTPLNELIARMVQQAVQQESEDEFETFDEANDFDDVDPDALDMSPYELTELRPESAESAELEAETAREAVEEPKGDPEIPEVVPEAESRPDDSGEA